MGEQDKKIFIVLMPDGDRFHFVGLRVVPVAEEAWFRQVHRLPSFDLIEVTEIQDYTVHLTKKEQT